MDYSKIQEAATANYYASLTEKHRVEEFKDTQKAFWMLDKNSDDWLDLECPDQQPKEKIEQALQALTVAIDMDSVGAPGSNSACNIM